jgi:hypothetical protein
MYICVCQTQMKSHICVCQTQMSYCLYARSYKSKSSTGQLLYKCNDEDEFLEKVTAYMVATHRLHIESEDDVHDSECMYSDYPETMKDDIKDKMRLAKSGIEYSFEEDDVEIIIVYRKYICIHCTAKWNNVHPIHFLQLSTIHPEVKGKWNDVVAASNKRHRLLECTQDTWVHNTKTESEDTSTLMVTDKITRKDMTYCDLMKELHTQGDGHPLWGRYVDVPTHKIVKAKTRSKVYSVDC